MCVCLGEGTSLTQGRIEPFYAQQASTDLPVSILHAGGHGLHLAAREHALQTGGMAGMGRARGICAHGQPGELVKQGLKSGLVCAWLMRSMANQGFLEIKGEREVRLARSHGDAGSLRI